VLRFLPKTRYEEGKDEIFRQFNAPALLASKMGIDINGFFGSRRSHDEEERLKSYSKLKTPLSPLSQTQLTKPGTWYRCLVKMIYPYKLSTGKDYKWYEMTFVSRWEAPGSEQILCIDTPEDFPSALSAILGDTAVDFNDPFAMHLPLLQEVVRLNDKSVWAIRDPIRDVEKVGVSEVIHVANLTTINRGGQQLAQISRRCMRFRGTQSMYPKYLLSVYRLLGRSWSSSGKSMKNCLSP
jgi:hypothetical protein